MDEQNTKQCNGYEAMYTFLNDEDFERHLKECPQCAKEHEKMQKVSNIIQITAGEYHISMLDADGSIWSTGYNSNGQLSIDTMQSIIALGDNWLD